MRIVRSTRRDNFTIIDQKAINDSSLSFRARGLLVYLLDKPDSWITSSTRLVSEAKEGRDAIRTALKELEDAGYLVRRKRQSKRTGRYETLWIIRETPRTGFQASVAQASDY